MQLGLCAVVVFLSLADLADSISSTKTPKGKRQRRISTEVSQGCAKGCDLCSEFNGCLKCSPKLFILLERNDIRQTGICLPSCPLGYFDVRNPDMNKCMKCKIDNCEDCFSRNFCTKCKDGLYLHKGKCHAICPEGFSVANGTTECSSPGWGKRKEEQGRRDLTKEDKNQKDAKESKAGIKKRKGLFQGPAMPAASV
ncbi:R-spondin-1 isoform X1 [Python bivittatus]|uniref:R-spondin-1 isoform X1 n=1 Tax=Python bivittatus TaxID=176946 RepID=A0A9F5N0G3_PYTBI|nr:R-spondin-1 isoform X1 [Python bivittatus]